MKILVADDHPSILLAFKAMLNSCLESNLLEFSECLSCEETYRVIEDEFSKERTFELALLDYSRPSYS